MKRMFSIAVVLAPILLALIAIIGFVQPRLIITARSCASGMPSS